MSCALGDERLGVEGDAEAGGGEHGEIISAVADGDRLLERDVFLRGDFLEELRLALGVDDLALDLAGQDAALDLQVVGADVVDAELLLQVQAEEGEAAGDDGGLVAE